VRPLPRLSLLCTAPPAGGTLSARLLYRTGCRRYRRRPSIRCRQRWRRRMGVAGEARTPSATGCWRGRGFGYQGLSDWIEHPKWAGRNLAVDTLVRVLRSHGFAVDTGVANFWPLSPPGITGNHGWAVLGLIANTTLRGTADPSMATSCLRSPKPRGGARPRYLTEKRLQPSRCSVRRRKRSVHRPRASSRDGDLRGRQHLVRSHSSARRPFQRGIRSAA
jgi:hypothetical protein